MSRKYTRKVLWAERQEFLDSCRKREVDARIACTERDQIHEKLQKIRALLKETDEAASILDEIRMVLA